MCVQLHIEQGQISKNFRIQSEIRERLAVPERKGQNSITKRMTGECFQWKANESCSKVDSCCFLHSHASENRETPSDGAPAVDNERRRKGKEQASSSVPTGRRQTDDKRSKSPEVRPATGAKICCPWRRCRKSSCDYRHPPVCRNHKSGNRCIHVNNRRYRHADGKEKPSKRSKSESTQGAVAILTESPRLCISKFRSKEVYSAKPGQTRLNASAGHALKFSGRTWYEVQNRERKGPSRGVIQKGDPHERNLCAPKFEERTPEKTSRQEEFARKAAWNLARKIYKLKAEDKATFYSPVENKGTSASLQKHRRTYVCGDSGVLMHMLSKKDLSSDDMDTLRRSRNTTTVVTAKEEVQTNDEAQVYHCRGNNYSY